MNNNQKREKEDTRIYAVVLFLVGVILLIIALYADYRFSNGITSILLMACTAISGALLTAAIGIITFKQSGIVKYIKMQAENVLMSDEYINNLSLDKLKRIKEKINAILFNPNVAAEKDSLLNYTLESIEPLLSQYYYEEYTTEIKIELCGDNKDILEKTIKKELYIKPMTEFEKCKIQLNDILRGSIGSRVIGGLATIEVKRFCVDEKDFKVKVNFLSSEDKGGGYQEKYELVYEDDAPNIVIVPKKGCRVMIKFITRVVIDDLISAIKLPIPCRNYLTRVRYDHKLMDVKCTAFGFTNSKDLSVENECGEDMIIKAKNWTLPGDGIVLRMKMLS